MASRERDPEWVISHVVTATGEPRDYAARIISQARQAIDTQLAGGWAIVAFPLVAVHGKHRIASRFLERASSAAKAERTVDIEVEDWEALASYLDVSIEEIVDDPIGELISVLLQMETMEFLKRADMERALGILEAWADTFETAGGSIRRYRPDPSVFGHMPAGTVIGRADLAALLKGWVDSGPATTIGIPGPNAHISIEMGDVDLYLAADTTLAAVRRFLDHCTAAGTDEPWFVLPTRNGQVKKVSFEAEPVPGWYCYLTEPWGAPGRL